MSKKTNISVARYAAYRQFDLSGLDRATFRGFIRNVKDLREYDGSGERTVFFKFVEMTPKSEENIEFCKRHNERKADECMNLIRKLVNENTNYTI